MNQLAGGDLQKLFDLAENRGGKQSIVWTMRSASRPPNTGTEMVKVYTSSVIDAPATEVWALIRDFNGLPDWHPGVADSRIELEQPSDRVGCIRNLTLKGGGSIREQLLALSDHEFSCGYSILESPMGVENYIAALKLTPITDGDRCFAEWTAEFDCAPAREAELAHLIGQQVFQGGFDALKRRGR